MITVNNLTVDFGKHLLFDDVSFVVGDKERIALVGKNGAGKTTLLKILAGVEQPTSGTISITRGQKVGYLPQVMNFHDERTLWQEMEVLFIAQRLREEQLEELAHEMKVRNDHDSEAYYELLERYATLSDLVLMENKSHYEATIERTLLGLGFEREDFHRETSEFSGGWRMRIELAKVLLARPEILLLDEPTNHLDIESIEWLESYLTSCGVALVLISHDRTFLDATTERTLEIELGKLYDYKVSYSHYIKLREERLENQIRAYENQQKMIADTKTFIEKFRYKPTKSNQVQSRIKQLDKIQRIEIDEIDRKRIHFRFPVATRSGEYPLIVEDLAKSFGSKKIFSKVNFIIRRGEKVAFLGKNGTGKTTLLRCIMGLITDYQGSLTIGYNVTISYFSQNRAQELDPTLSIYETVDRVAKGDVRTQIDNMLGAFMFGGEIADKPVAVLSGGERSCLAVLLLLLEPANLLILDEPTNHLDIRSKEVLKEAIQAYNGTVILVSHDRYFLDGLVDKVYEFANGQVVEHIGGIRDYLHRKHQATLASFDKQTSPKSDLNSSSVVSKSESSSAQTSYQERKQQQKKLRATKNRLSATEEEIDRLEKELKSLEQEIEKAGTIPADDPIYKRHQTLQSELEEALNVWEEVAQELETLTEE